MVGVPWYLVFNEWKKSRERKKKKKGGKKFRTGRKAGERGQGREKWLGSFACAIYLSKFTTRNVTLEPRVILDYRYKGFFTFQATLDSTVHEVKSRNFCKGKHVVVGRLDFHLFKVFCKSRGIVKRTKMRMEIRKKTRNPVKTGSFDNYRVRIS